MKKNTMMRIASMILVLTLLSTCAISGTFAKYTTQDSGSDVARVAKWGVVLQAEGDLYGTKYDGGTSLVVADNTADTEVSVSGTQIANTNVVAPGTKNDKGFHFTVEGTPEVASKASVDVWSQNIYLAANKYAVMVKYGSGANAGKISEETYNDIMARTDDLEKLYVETAAGSGVFKLASVWTATTDYFTLEDYVDLTATYYPVEYALAGDDGVAYNTDWAKDHSEDTLAEIAKKIAQAANANAAVLEDYSEARNATFATLDKSQNITGYSVVSANYDPNAVLETVLNLDNCILTWKWDFEQTAGEEGNAASATDKADTILGNLMAERVDGEASSNTFDAKVVHLDGEQWIAPVEYTDFCLDTQFGIDITVTQVD